ncbi:DUF3108 domain-containing protein [Leptothrix discophora]|uniref:DUF3108 domain-containing protein n=1 Tax=Leptothrix discophora TaxID=89 RepID=A0ABT9G7V5_LEPDI|nr:DUF3108 domain-containing protein [Leptothrix discophora]MDP4302564.1 DUF3108 domain-containing protein [Leptothrix discophora]
MKVPRLTPALVGAALLALLGHVWLIEAVRDSMQAIDLRVPEIRRAEVRFDRVLAPTAPVEVQAVRPKPAPTPRLAQAAAAPRPPEPAASDAADPAAELAADRATEQAAEQAAEQARQEAERAALAVADAQAAADAASAAQAAASAAQAAATPVRPGLPEFVWPVSTRLSYRLTGWYRGEVNGHAEVEWLRLDAQRYQVHLSVSIGPAFAPLMTRRMSSEGRITPEGLAPQRYEQLTQQIIGRDRQVTMAFEPGGIRLARGDSVPYQGDVQDTASQFIQIIYLLRTRPDLARTGQAMAFPLALPNRVDAWVYEVAEKVVEQTPVGPLETLHVKPRRRAEGGNLTAQMWYAPTLQMLPVRIRIEQDAQTWVDLRLERAPEQGS